MSENLQWDSSISFLLAMIGAAVGLGNIWRFSYVLYSNGGGSFFIPYFLAIAILGIPFLILEYGLGFSFKDSFSNILKSINERFEYIAWMLLLFVFIVVCYYMVIISWDLIYLLSSFTFSWGADPTVYFANFVGGDSNLANAWTVLIPTAIATLFIWAILWFISHKDLNEGIGKVAKVLIPALFVMMAIIVFYAFTLPGHMIGIYALIRPNWSTLLDIDIWLAACGQIIFSLSMGQAIAMTYASYLPDKSKLADNVLLVVAANSLFEIFTAFGVFSVLGFMSLHSGIRLSNLVAEGTGLVFDVFPMIFNVMGPFAKVLAPLFFLAIFFAGITSALGLFEPMLSSISHKYNLSRRQATTILSIIGCAISLLFTTGIGSYLIGIIDEFINEFGILFLIGLQCIIFGWFYKIEDLVPILNDHGTIKVGKKWIFVIKYLLPVLILGIWIYGLYDLFYEASAFELMIDLIIVVVVLVMSFILTKRKSRIIE
ncbi:sodium-dependent transporter [Methanobrevibacter sp.]|uniref:sodium-dependent transporter n=1 Tax=Methanobrevibacter sp. TaxID=66852 RepID=UPI00388F2637